MATRAQIVRQTKSQLRAHGLLTANGLRVTARQQELKNRLKRARKAMVGPKGRLPNGFFDTEAIKKAKRVTKIRPVRDRETGEKGEIIGTAPGGWVKVQWRDRAKPTLIKRTEIRRGRYPNVGVRTGNPGPLDLVYGLQAYDWISKKKIHNPSETVNQFSRKFQGRTTGAIKEFKAASNAPENLARVGKLIEIHVSGRKLKLPGAMVAASPAGKLWIVSNRVPLLNQKAQPGALLDFGEIDKIVYLTAKTHIGNGQTFEYDHDFEDRKPHFCVNSEGMPVIRGGSYTIESGGITG